jgi:hypothetical protein
MMTIAPSLSGYKGRAVCLTLATTVLSSCGLAAQDRDLPASDRALQPRVEEVFRVGKIDGADWEIFGERPEVAFDGAGNLYVFDPTSHRVVVVNSSGRFVRQIGRRGDGPGELRTPGAFTVMRDETVVIADLGHAAFLVFGPDGSYQRSVSFRGNDGITVVGNLLGDPRGGSVFSSGRRMTMMQRQPGGGAATPPSDREIVRFDLANPGGGRPFYTGWEPAPSQGASRGPGSVGGPGGLGVRPMPRAFEPALFTAVLPNGGLVVSDSTAYNLKILSPTGRVERTLRRPLRPTPVTAQIQRAERDRRLAEMDAGRGPQVQVSVQGGPGGGGGGGGGGPSQAQMQQVQRRQLEQLEFYPELSVITGLSTGWTGKIWVSRRGTGRDILERGPVDVLTPTGDYLGSIAASGIRAPDAFGPSGLAAWIERDRFDTPIMVVRRLPVELR